MESKLQSLRKKSKFLTVAMIAVAIIIISLSLYYAGNGFSLNDTIFGTNDDVRVMIDSPHEGDVFYSYDNIDIAGSVWGDIPQKVFVWDERYNVPVTCTLQGTTFGVRLFAEDLAVGQHVLCIQAQTEEGKWTAVERVQIEKRGTTSSQTGWVNPATTWSETYLPQPLAVVFRPVEEVLAQIVVYVSGGTSDDDLNGDNIPDELQQAPTTPRHNPMNLPLSGIIIFGLIIFVIIILIVYIIYPYLDRRQQLKKAMLNDPNKRLWLLQMKALKNKELKSEIKKEKSKRSQLIERIKKAQSASPKAKSKPIRIYLSPKSKNGSKKETQVRWK